MVLPNATDPEVKLVAPEAAPPRFVLHLFAAQLQVNELTVALHFFDLN
jgi:hypothetical protein